MKTFNKAALILITTLTATHLCNAQSKWSAGYQAGLGTLNVNADKVAFTNQVFVNRKITKKIEIEAGLGYTSWNNRTSELDGGWPGDYKLHSYTLNLTLSAKYHFIQRSKWSLYIPLAISNAYIHNQSKVVGDYNPFEWFTYSNSKMNFAYCISSGLGGNISLSKHFYLNAQFTAGLKTQKTLATFDTRKATDGNAIAYGAQVGIGYKF